jgi:hypothetical protein
MSSAAGVGRINTAFFTLCNLGFCGKGRVRTDAADRSASGGPCIKKGILRRSLAPPKNVGSVFLVL